MLSVNRKTELPLADVQGLLQRELQEHREAFEATARMVSEPFAEHLCVHHRIVHHERGTKAVRERGLWFSDSLFGAGNFSRITG